LNTMEKTERQQIAAMLGKKGGETTAKRYTKEQLAAWGRKGAATKRAIGIGMLRQWLNEDRIDDPKKMVTNEDIAFWLNHGKKDIPTAQFDKPAVA